MSERIARVPNSPNADEMREVIIRGDGVGFAQDIFVGPHRLAADEPSSMGGTDTGPTPYDFLLAALGT